MESLWTQRSASEFVKSENEAEHYYDLKLRFIEKAISQQNQTQY